MPITFSEILLGSMKIEQNGKEFEIQIRKGNCLAVFIYETENEYHLYNFYADVEHIKNIKNNNNGKLLFDNVLSCSLNLKYKESVTLAKYFTMDGLTVSCYYN